MTSEERHEVRYQRRKAKRAEKRRAETKALDDFDAVFSYEHLYESYRQCRKGVSWKASVQKYIALAPLEVLKSRNALLSGKYKPGGFYEFDVCERGKTRHIKSVRFDERVIQRCLCDYSLTPILSRSFIYDNGASLPGKGYTFTIKRLEKHLHDYIRANGTDGYILLFDFSKFFDNIDHDYIKGLLRKAYTDERILQLLFQFIDTFGVKGLGLGSQISQTLALASADRLDHHFKDTRSFKYYGRYMDDGYVIGSKAELRQALAELKAICQECHITLNEKKTQIIKLTHGFTWLHANFIVTNTGKVLKTMCRQSVTRCRRRLKSFHDQVIDGRMSMPDVDMSLQSWLAYAKTFSSFKTRQSIINLKNLLFTEENQCTTRFASPERRLTASQISAPAGTI